MIPGEVMQLGRHHLACGDAFNSEHVDALLQGERADVLYCDPPYGIALDVTYTGDVRMEAKERIDSHGGGRFRGGTNYLPVIGDDAPFDPTAIIGRFDECREQFWWGADSYRKRIPDDGSWVVWDKRTTEEMDKPFGSCFELCWSRQKHKRLMARIKWSGLFGVEQEPERKRFHPTQKPVALAEFFLKEWSAAGEVVVDLFGGSGSTLLACERLGMSCRMMEISPDYCDLIVTRYEALTRQPSLFDLWEFAS